MDLENNYLTPNWVSCESAWERCQAAQHPNTAQTFLGSHSVAFVREGGGVFFTLLHKSQAWKYRGGTACFCVCDTSSSLLTPAGWYATGRREAERLSVTWCKQKTKPLSKQKYTRAGRKERNEVEIGNAGRGKIWKWPSKHRWGN